MRQQCALPTLALALAAAPAIAADYAGTYHGDIKGQPSSVELTADGAAYAGTIRMGSLALPCRATERDDHLAGTFTSGGSAFDFTATLSADTLSLSTAGATYTLTRPPSNPLDSVASPAPAATAVDAALLASTSTGRAVFFQWPAARTAADALHATTPLLAKLVGGPTTVTGAFADAKTQTRGGASFTGTDGNGRPIRGMILVGGNTDAGEAASVLYATTNAPDTDWAALRAALPKAPLKLHTFQFPDGTGSVDLPEGWSTKATSLDFGFTATGPDDQSVGYGQSLAVQAPDSQLIQMMLRTEAQARQMGIQPPPRPPMLVAPFSAPGDAVQALIPQIDPILRQSAGFGLRFDKMLSTQDATASLPGGRGAQMSYTLFKVGPTAERKLRTVALAETVPITGGSWMFCSTEMSAPDEQFDAVAPAMTAILKSVRANQRVMLEHQQARSAAQQQQFDQQQQAHREQMAEFDKYNQGWRDRELATSRCNDDFCEIIRGYRTVTDTATGDSRSVDLNAAQGIADALNRQAGDPNRFVPIPLRDEMHPLNP